MIKSILVRVASTTLYLLSSIPVRDASNGFRLFSRRLLNTINVESKVGFAYSLELLAKTSKIPLVAFNDIPHISLSKLSSEFSLDTKYYSEMAKQRYIYKSAKNHNL